MSDLETSVLLTGLRIWDGRGESYSDADALRIDGDRIGAIGSRADLSNGVREIDAAGLTVLPGLIDAHVHLSIDPTIRSPHDQPSGEPVRTSMIERVERMAKAGITTARDLGGGEWIELGVRDAIAADQMLGPRLVLSLIHI